MANLNPQPVKHFTRANPCNKIDLFNCFATKTGYRPRAVIEARGEIGMNAPTYLIRKGYLVLRSVKDVDYWVLTPVGEAWLTQGTARHVTLHPDSANELAYDIPTGKAKEAKQATARLVLRRTK